MSRPNLSDHLPWRGELLAYAKGLLANKDDAEDVVQEVHLRAWMATREDERGPQTTEAMRGWLFAWVYFTSKVMNRAHYKWVRVGRRGTTDEAPGKGAAGREFDEALVEALQHLDPQQQQTICLLLDGYNQNEVAELLGVDQSTVSRLFRRALDEVEGGRLETEEQEGVN